MTRATHSPLFVTKELFETRYPGAEAIFVAGSVVRGEASTYSDLDLVVLFKKVDVAYRESFSHREWPVEAFIHDPETIRYFFDVVDPGLGRATLAEMILEGHEVPGPTALTMQLKERAAEVLKNGPQPLSSEEVTERRYQITELIDDIREPRSRQELVATATVIFNDLADYYFRSRRGWSGTGKSVLKRLKKDDPAFARRFSEAFDELFVKGLPQRVIELAAEVLAKDGGFLFEGYRRETPRDWRA